MAHEYAEVRNGGYYVAGSRVSLASIVYAFRDGASPETIRQNFPSLSLAQVYGAIAFSLDNPTQVNAYMDGLNAQWRQLEKQSEPPGKELRNKLEEARTRLFASQR